MTIRLGILGAGGHSRATHGPALHHISGRHPERMELAAVCDLDLAKAEDYRAEFGFARAYTDATTMLAEEELHGLIVVTPLKLTEKVVSELLPHGIPLLMEKPPGETAAATRRLLDLAERHQTPHMISFNRRFNPAVVKARQWLAEGGESRRPRMVLGRMLRHARREEGFAIGTGVHLVDAVLSLLGAPESVDTVRLPAGRAGCYQFYAQAKYADDRAALLVIAPVAGALEETLEIHGQDYCLKLDVREQAAVLWQGGHLAWEWRAPSSDARPIQDVIGETEAFVRSIEGRQSYWPGLREGVVSMQVAEAIQHGARVQIHSATVTDPSSSLHHSKN